MKKGFCWKCISFQTIKDDNESWREGVCSRCGVSYKPSGWIWVMLIVIISIIAGILSGLR